MCVRKAAGSYCGTAGKLYPRPYDLGHRRRAARPQEGRTTREAALLSCWMILTAPPAGETKHGAPPPHPRKGRRQSETRRQAEPDRKNKQTYDFLLLPTRAAEARKASSKLSEEREADARQKRAPGQTRSGRRTQRPQAPPPQKKERPAGAYI